MYDISVPVDQHTGLLKSTRLSSGKFGPRVRHGYADAVYFTEVADVIIEAIIGSIV